MPYMGEKYLGRLTLNAEWEYDLMVALVARFYGMPINRVISLPFETFLLLLSEFAPIPEEAADE